LDEIYERDSLKSWMAGPPISTMEKRREDLNEIGGDERFFPLFCGHPVSSQSVEKDGDVERCEDVKPLGDRPSDHPCEYISCSS
jgi:hypothetical protein